MAGESIDTILDKGAQSLEYFDRLIMLARAMGIRVHVDWQRDFCRVYDRERGINLAALIADAAAIRGQAGVAHTAINDQDSAKSTVLQAWNDSAGKSARSTLDAHQARSTTTAAPLAATASAAEEAVGAVLRAVALKVDQLSEFNRADLPLLSAASYGVSMLLSRPNGDLVKRVAKQLEEDSGRFAEIATATTNSITAAYQSIIDAAAAADPSAFPAPKFAAITAGNSGTAAAPGTSAGPAAPSAPSGGSAPAAGASTGNRPPSSGAVPPAGASAASAPTQPGVAQPVTAEPTTTQPTTTQPTTTMPSGGAPSAATTLPASAMPADLASMSGLSGQNGMPSWLQQLVPALMDKLTGAAENPLDTGSRDVSDDKVGSDADDGAGAKKPDPDEEIAEPAADDPDRPTVEATLSPDGTTVEVTVRNPDGTTHRARLAVEDDGSLTCLEATDDPALSSGQAQLPVSGAEPPAPGGLAQDRGAVPTGGVTPGETAPAASPPPAAPASVPTDAAAPSAPAPADGAAASGVGGPAPAHPAGEGKGGEGTGGQKTTAPPGATEDPAPEAACPPGEDASGAEFAVTVS